MGNNHRGKGKKKVNEPKARNNNNQAPSNLKTTSVIQNRLHPHFNGHKHSACKEFQHCKAIDAD